MPQGKARGRVTGEYPSYMYTITPKGKGVHILRSCVRPLACRAARGGRQEATKLPLSITGTLRSDFTEHKLEYQLQESVLKVL